MCGLPSAAFTHPKLWYATALIGFSVVGSSKKFDRVDVASLKLDCL